MRASTGHEEIEYECLAESGVTGELSRQPCSVQCSLFLKGRSYSCTVQSGRTLVEN